VGPGQQRGHHAAESGPAQHATTFEPAAPVVPTAIPKSLSDGISIGRQGVRLSLDTASGQGSGQTGVPTGRRVFYGDGAGGDDTDVLAEPTGLGAELTLQLRSANSPQDFMLNLSLPAGVTLAVDGQAIDAVQNGTVIGTLEPPQAADAQGQPVPVHYLLDGNTVILSVPHQTGDWGYPILVDPVYDDWWDSGQAWAAGSTGGIGNWYRYADGPFGFTTSGSYGDGLYVEQPAGSSFPAWTEGELFYYTGNEHGPSTFIDWAGFYDMIGNYNGGPHDGVINNGSGWHLVCGGVVPDPTAHFSCPWNTVGYRNGSYTVAVNIYDNASNGRQVTTTTTVANPPPVGTLSVESPYTLSTTLINGTATADASGVSHVDIYALLAGSSTWQLVCGGVTVSAGAYTCAWNTTSGSYPNGTYTVAANIYDGAGNMTQVTESTTLVNNLDPGADFSDAGDFPAGSASTAAGIPSDDAMGPQSRFIVAGVMSRRTVPLVAGAHFAIGRHARLVLVREDFVAARLTTIHGDAVVHILLRIAESRLAIANYSFLATDEFAAADANSNFGG